MDFVVLLNIGNFFTRSIYCMYVCMCVGMYVCMYVCIYIYIYMYDCIYVCMLYMYECMYVCIMCVCIHACMYGYEICVYCLNNVCIDVLSLDAGLMARRQYPEGPTTGHLDIRFSWFPCAYKRMLRWFPSFQVATTCLSCSPPDLNSLVTFFSYLCTCKTTTATS
jgi:nuclear pore complex protein Nup62